MSPRKRLGEMLIEAGVIDDAQLQSALGHQRRWGGRLGQALLDLKMVSEPVIVDALARKGGFEVARLGELERYSLDLALKLVPREFAARNNAFPISADTSTITVAMSDPTNLALTDELQFRTGRRVKVCIGGDREIAEAIRFHYPLAETPAPSSIALDVENTGDGVPLAEPFEGGSTEDMRAMLMTPQKPAAATPVPGAFQAVPAAAAPAARPAPAGRGQPTGTFPAAAPPAGPAARPAATGTNPIVTPQGAPAPRPAVTGTHPAAPPRGAPTGGAAPRAPAGSSPAPAQPPAAGPAPAARALTGTHPTVPPQPAPAPRPAATGAQPAVAPPAAPAPRPGATGAHAAVSPRGQPTGNHPAVRPAAPAPAPAPFPADAATAARDDLLGAIPRGGFAPEDPFEELTPAPDEGEPLLATDLAPEEEMVEGRVPIRELTPRDVAILDALDRLAAGIDDPNSPVKPARLAGALLRLLLAKKLISEQDLLDELTGRG